jgi:hypothetical protein
MRTTFLLIPAVFVCGGLFLSAMADDAAASTHAGASACADCAGAVPAAIACSAPRPASCG